jgi:hypothetical protein
MPYTAALRVLNSTLHLQVLRIEKNHAIWEFNC